MDGTKRKRPQPDAISFWFGSLLFVEHRERRRLPGLTRRSRFLFGEGVCYGLARIIVCSLHHIGLRDLTCFVQSNYRWTGFQVIANHGKAPFHDCLIACRLCFKVQVTGQTWGVGLRFTGHWHCRINCVKAKVINPDLACTSK